MLLRNYDNYQAISKMCGMHSTHIYFVTSAVFGDGVFSFKDTSGVIGTNDYWNYSESFRLPMFSLFYNSNATGGSSGLCSSSLVCGYEDGEVGYDDYKIDNKSEKLTPVTHSTTTVVLNENNELESTYTKILCNTGSEDITINCIGVEFCAPINNKSYNRWLIYKEKINEITIAPNQNVVLTFTTKAPLGQNKPADYVATASVE